MFFYQRWLNRIINNDIGKVKSVQASTCICIFVYTTSHTAQCVHESNHKKIAHGRKVLDDGKMKGIN